MDEKKLPEVQTTDVAVNADATPAISAATEAPPVQRRDFLKRAGATSLAVGIMSLVPDYVRHAAWAAGSDAPELKEIKIGFIPLTDCSSVVMANVMEFDKKYGIKDGPSLAKLIKSEKAEYTFAQTFPTGTHAMWLYYWLSTYGIDPFKDVKTIVVPPPQMVANMRVGNMDGYCVGEPWGNRAIMDKIGFTGVTTQAIWKDHPEKVLGTTAEFTKRYPNTSRAMTAAIIEAGKWIDASLSNRQKTAETVADKSYVNTDKDVILERMLGRYSDGIGKTWDDPDAMKFYNDGYVTYPFLSDGMWFLTQHRRWGLLKDDVDYLGVAKAVNRLDIYKAAADLTKTPIPKSPMRTVKMIDGTVWDGKDPKKYAASFKIRAS